MDAHGDALAQARRAAAARDWPTAAAQFDVLESEQLPADDLAAYADAVRCASVLPRMTPSWPIPAGSRPP